MLLICYVVAGAVKISSIFIVQHLIIIDNKTNPPSDPLYKCYRSDGGLVPEKIMSIRVRHKNYV